MKRLVVFIVLCVFALFPNRLYPALFVPIPEIVIEADKRPPYLTAVFDDDAVKCLAENIYFEARGEGEIGMKAVAFVTLNRVSSARYPNHICGVVFDDGQFTWDHDAPRPPETNSSWQRSIEIAQHVLINYGTEPDPTNGSLFYHEKSIRPYWSVGSAKVASIGNHVFYRQVNDNRQERVYGSN